MWICLAGKQCIVATDFGITMKKSTQREQDCRITVRDIVVDRNIQNAITACMAHGHYCLKLGSANQISTGHALYRLVRSLSHNSIPMCRLSHCAWTSLGS